jgi:hypothetical protein
VLSPDKWLAVIGSAFELFGLFVLALGIIETRQTFDPSRPSLAYRIFGPLIRRINRWRGRVHTLEIDAASHAHTAANAVMRRGFSFQGGLEENVQRLQAIAQDHENSIADLQSALDREQRERETGDKAGAEALREIEQRLHNRIREAAAGGLAKETWGVGLFFLGVVFTLLGTILS